MKMIINNILLSFLFLSGSCGNNSNQSTILEDKLSMNVNDSIKVISNEQAKPLLDTMAILSNKNLTSLLKAFDNQELKEIDRYASIPEFIRSYLNLIVDKEFVIANKGENWQATDLVTENLPTRQLIYFGYNQSVALMAYNKGGIGKSECLLIFKLNNDIISDFWCGNVLAELTNKSEILKYIRKNQYVKRKLNTNVIQL